MTRRRAVALVFAALGLVFVIGSIVTITQARSQLIGGIDRELANQLDLNLQFYNVFTLDALDDIVIRENELATTIVDPLGTVELQIPAGFVADPLPLPDLPASRIIDRVGETFTVSGTDGGPGYRVIVGRLDDERFVALAAPLEDVRTTLSGLGRTLLVTLFSMIVVLGVVFWLLLRASLRPYDELVDTAQAIAGGDLDRRATAGSSALDIGRLTAALNTMLDKIQESFHAREQAEARVKQFAADASHELRTPLTTIAGYSELYLSGAATDHDATTKQMSRINSEASRMGRLVNDLLMLARLDQGSGLNLQALDVTSIVIDAVSDRRVVDPDQTLTLTVSDDAGVDGATTVVGDPDALHQVIINLLANASIHAPGADVDVRVDVAGGDVLVTVADDGPGMTADVAAHVFDRFFRADRARTTSARSSGLGLSIVSTITDALGGAIDLETAPGAGSTFTVRLPSVPQTRAEQLSGSPRRSPS